jgi:hypothetical protein
MGHDDSGRRRGDLPLKVRDAFKVLEEACRTQQQGKQAKAVKAYLQLVKRKKTASLFWLVVYFGGF